MVGLSILLEAHKKSSSRVTKSPQVINKTITIKPSRPSLTPSLTSYPSSPLPAITFLESCFLCKQRLLPGKDIYMYKGDRAFCSVECRCRQIFMDEESVGVSNRDDMNCSLAALKPAMTNDTSTTSPSCSTSRHNHQRKGNRNRGSGFAY
ncbi:hypothetical protein IFM89_017469 [Coptis chinensis]|uniref:FLZ-type domain-containing protein n=1 Tax=Coptis chinensis TaxID=261450 RepID=A0A835HR47_9MAGN|nr:hypothetical protein IFM89_017469 [Coptis chinensis]